MNIHPMWNTYPTLSKELTTTLRLMEQAVQIDNQEIQAAVHDMIHSGGKLLRQPTNCCSLILVNSGT